MFRSKKKIIPIDQLIKRPTKPKKDFYGNKQIDKIIAALNTEIQIARVAREQKLISKLEQINNLFSQVKNFNDVYSNKVAAHQVSSMKKHLETFTHQLIKIKIQHMGDPVTTMAIDYCIQSLKQPAELNGLKTEMERLEKEVETLIPEINSSQLIPVSLPSGQNKAAGILGSGAYGVVKVYGIKDPKLLQRLKDLGFCEDPPKKWNPQGPNDPSDPNRAEYHACIVMKENLYGDSAEFKDEGKRGKLLWLKSLFIKSQQNKEPVCSISAGTTLDGVDVVMCRYERNGSLVDYLANLNANSAGEIRGQRAELLKRVIHTAFANMQFFHEGGIFHLDTADRNIVITKDGNAVRIDLGISIEENKHGLTQINRDTGPIRWMDYLSIKGKIASAYSDLYSLKVTILQFVLQVAGESDPLALFDDMPDTSDYFAKLIAEGDASVLGALINRVDKYLGQSPQDPRHQEAAYVLNCYRDFLAVNPSKKRLDEVLATVSRPGRDEEKKQVVNQFASAEVTKALHYLNEGEKKFNANLNAFKAGRYQVHFVNAYSTQNQERSARRGSNYGGLPDLANEGSQNTTTPIVGSALSNAGFFSHSGKANHGRPLSPARSRPDNLQSFVPGRGGKKS